MASWELTRSSNVKSRATAWVVWASAIPSERIAIEARRRRMAALSLLTQVEPHSTSTALSAAGMGQEMQIVYAIRGVLSSSSGPGDPNTGTNYPVSYIFLTQDAL